MFRDVLYEDKKRAKKYDIDQFMSKIDIGLLGFLWCQGTREDKAAFLFDLLLAKAPIDPNVSLVSNFE